MTPQLPGIDVRFLANVVGRLTERRLNAYYPGRRRSAVALILRFDEATQPSLRAALTSFRVVSRSHPPHHDGTSATGATAPLTSFSAALGGHGAGVDPVELLHYLQDHCVDPVAPSALQLLFLQRADVDASRWSGQVAFPGGRRDPDDADDFHTVCRSAYDELGLPLQHSSEFACLGRLPDYKLRSRAMNSSGVVQARFVFLHVGDMTPTVQLATHEVASARWVSLRRLAAAHIEHGCVVHPLQSFIHPQDADYRLLLTELFPGTFFSFPSISLPLTEADEHTGVYTANTDTCASSSSSSSPSAASSARAWRVWGLTLRSANELLALDNRQPFDWPLIESNSRVLQYGILFPFHGYYELLCQYYLWRAWLAAQRRLVFRSRSHVSRTKAEGAVEKRDRRVLHGSAMERRYAVLPATADALLFAAPEQPVTEHIVCFLGVVGFVILICYTVARVVAGIFAAVGQVFCGEAALEREERRWAYYDANVRGGSNRTRSSGDAPLMSCKKNGGAPLSEMAVAGGASECEGTHTDKDEAGTSAAAPLVELSVQAGDRQAGGERRRSEEGKTKADTSALSSLPPRQRRGVQRAADEAALAAELGDDAGRPSEASSELLLAAAATATTTPSASTDTSARTSAAATKEGRDVESGAGTVAASTPAVISKDVMYADESGEAELLPPSAMRGVTTSVDSPHTSQSSAPAVTAAVMECSYAEELQAVMDRYRGQ
jgi:8-oxo-dGTP pyrophosphatase MutT (NUDIX family)